MPDRPNTISSHNEVPLDLLLASEIRYRRLFESARDGILILDAVTRKITDVNPFMIELLGYSHEEFLGRELWEIGFFKDEESGKEAFRELLDKGYIRYEDLQIKTKAGKRCDIEVISNVYTEGDRQVIQCNVRDITHHKQTLIALRESENRLRSIIETEPECVKVVSREGVLLEMNRAGLAMLEAETLSEIQAKNLLEFMVPEYRQAFLNLHNSVMEGKNCTLEFEVIGLKGGRLWLETHATPLRDAINQTVALLGVTRDITARKRAEKSLNESAERYRDLIENAHDIIYTHDLQGNYTSVNQAVEHITGYTREEALRMNLTQTVVPEDLEKAQQMVSRKLAGENITAYDLEIMAKDGHRVAIEVNTRIIWDNGVPVGVQGIARDITERKNLEEQLHQSQKLESVGLLAGGIAHDFNNMLTAINGYSDLILRKLESDSPLRSKIEEIKKAGLRSAALTHQLLAFSRQQVLHPVVLDLNEVIADTITMLQRLIGEDIQLTSRLNPKTGRVKVDPGQFSQIVMNLAVNARDAMPQGGQLTIETANIFLEPDYTRHHSGVLPGAYVMLAVSDTGMGMSDKIKQHIFDPFFTTKEVGRGTGLGLATVYGIVKQSGGHIEVYSEEGIGTTFKIYIPRVIENISESEIKDVSFGMPFGTETILLVEDEEIVRNLSREILQTCGYTVIEAENGAEALAVCANSDRAIDLLMTDVVMPQMGGRELATELAIRFPNLKILFTSGYTDDAVVRHGVIETNTNFIQKPFTPIALANKIREIIDN